MPSGRKPVHGLWDSIFYHTWSHMMSRCHNDKSTYFYNYGGRGITVCLKWHDIRVFIEWCKATYPKGATEKMTVDRIDNNKGYSPENCRWATRKEQSRNMRTNRIITTPWGELTIAEAAEKADMKYRTLHRRVNECPQEKWFTKVQN